MARTGQPGRSARPGRRAKLTLTFGSRRLKEPNGGPISRIAYPARIHQLGEPLSPQIAGAAVAGHNGTAHRPLARTCRDDRAPTRLIARSRTDGCRL